MKLARIAACTLAVVAPAAFASYSLSPPQAFPTGSWADAAAIGDVNGDGRQDVVLTTTTYGSGDNSKVFVFIQKADGTLDAPRKYAYDVGASHTGLALADLDHDGRMEIIVGHSTGITIFDWHAIPGKMAMKSRLHRSQEPWILTAHDIVVVDVNRDGAPDVVTQSGSGGYGANVYFGDGRGGITRQVKFPTPAQSFNDLESGDFNGDGYDDVVVLNGNGITHAYVYYNDGSDDFSAPLDINPNSDDPAMDGGLGAGDFNSDGRDDLVVMRDRTHLSLFYQDAVGALIQPPAILSSEWDPKAIIGHDLDLDGRDDVIVQHATGRLGIYLQGEAGLAAEVLTTGPYVSQISKESVAAGDINGDDCPDIAIANQSDGLLVQFGTGCNAVPDLAPSLGLTSSVVALRLDNFGDGDAVAPEASVVLSVLDGTLVVGSLPDSCSLESQSSRRARVTCTGPTLAAGTSFTQLLPVTIAGGDSRNVLNASASATTTSLEPRLENNIVSRLLRLGTFWTITPTVSTRTRLVR
jgi:hypothetical protein